MITVYKDYKYYLKADRSKRIAQYGLAGIGNTAAAQYKCAAIYKIIDNK